MLTSKLSLDLDERGVALPLALLGLVAVSLMVTTAMVTSSTEVSLSFAHQRGTQGLYGADAALEQFVAGRQNVGGTDALSPGTYDFTGGGGDLYQIVVGRMSEGAVITGTGGVLSRRDTYSLLSQPADGRGRSVAALIQVFKESTPVDLKINAGLTLGATTTVSGNATISDGSDGMAGCSAGVKASSAVEYGNDVGVTVQGSANIVGDTAQSTLSSAELISAVLGGDSIEGLASRANIQFGPEFGELGFVNGTKPRWDQSNSKYQWGCPAGLMTGCPVDEADYFPVIAIDAIGSGGVVKLSGDHGQGTLLIMNGSLEISGNFLFQGIIIVDGVTKITGTPQIEGAVIAMGSEAVIDQNADGLSSGNSLVRYNQCSVLSAIAGLGEQGLQNAPQVFDGSTFGWFEVIR
jgi:hypothetical protein